jgi:hypothetical protein
MSSVIDSVDFRLIQEEYAPNGQCQCLKFKDEMGCPYCNPALREAWRKSFDIENEMKKSHLLE